MTNRVLVITKAEKTYVKRKRAEALVHRGEARWDGNGAIRIVEQSHRVVSAARCQRAQVDAALDRAVKNGLATTKQLAGAFKCGDPSKLMTIGGAWRQWPWNPLPHPSATQNGDNHGIRRKKLRRAEQHAALSQVRALAGCGS